MTGGFILGFDSDRGDIFEQQRDFIERAAIPWAMAGFLQAPATTALHARMVKEGRMLDESDATSNFDTPNFRTLLPLPLLLQGFRETLVALYSPSAFYDRAYRSLQQWQVRKQQKATEYPLRPILGILARSIFRQGILSSYRKSYWKFLFQLLSKWSGDSPKFSMGITILLSGNHFIRYAKNLAVHLDSGLSKLRTEDGTTAISAHPR